MKLSNRLRTLEGLRPKDPTGGISVFFWEPQDEAALQEAQHEAASKGHHTLIAVQFVEPPIWPPDPPL